MLQWDIDIADVISVLADHETIEEYDDGTKLLLGRSGVRALHIVTKDDGAVVFVITVYEPDPLRWNPSFQRREEAE